MLACDGPPNWVEWTGQAVNGVLHPANVEQLWSDAELETAGLYRVTTDPVPSGQTATGWELQDRGGKPVLVPITIPTPPPPMPTQITNRQYYQQLAIMGPITQQEAADAVVGTPPPTILGYISSLPQAQQFDAEMFFKGGTIYDRHAALLTGLATYMGWSNSFMDTLWEEGSKL